MHDPESICKLTTPSRLSWAQCAALQVGDKGFQIRALDPKTSPLAAATFKAEWLRTARRINLSPQNTPSPAQKKTIQESSQNSNPNPLGTWGPQTGARKNSIEGHLSKGLAGSRQTSQQRSKTEGTETSCSLRLQVCSSFWDWAGASV